MKTPTLIVTLVSAAALLGCSKAPESSGAAPTGDAVEVSASQRFLNRIAEHCGNAYGGRIVENTPQMDNDPFDGQALVMHVRECSDQQVKVPFHVGDDHSRTWVLTVKDYGLQLKHDHRHEDGTDDAVTMYGGDSRGGTAERQEFPVDEESITLFREQGLTASVTNIWAMEIVPGQRFVYELAREGRLFRVEFDLTQTVEKPPTPWGHQ